MEEIAQVYARSLFEVAKDHDRLEVVHDQLGEFVDALESHRPLAMFFFSPYFSTEEKKDGLHRVIDGAESLLMNFLEVLVDNHRAPVLFRIRRELDALWAHEHRLLPVTVTSAIELDERLVRQIGDRISAQTGRHVELSSRVDPAILGGLVLQVGNSILDASIRNRLDQLRRRVARSA